MTMMLRRILAAIAALVTMIVLSAWGLWGGSILAHYVFFHVTPNAPLSAVDSPRPSSDPLTFWIICGALLLVSGIATALLVLTPRPKFRTRGIIYLLFFAVILPASAYNYDQGDAVMGAPLQVGLNLVLIFLASTVSQWMSTASPTEPDVRTLKYLGIFLLLAAGVLIPGLFTTLWALWRIHLLKHVVLDSLSPGALSSVAAVASAVISWLNYKRELRKEATEDGDRGSMAGIRP